MSNRAKKKRMALGKKVAEKRLRQVCLSRTLSEGGATISVDREQGVIRNVSIISTGDAVGHGFRVDGVMLSQVYAHLSSGKRYPVRLTHPEEFGGRDGIELLVGYIENATLTGEQVRGDVRLGKFAEHSPAGNGNNIREFLLSVAEESPELIGLSITYAMAEDEVIRGDRPSEDILLGRVEELLSVDFVGDPGANRNGLLSKGHGALEHGGKTMDPQLLADLTAILELPEGTTEEDVLAVIRAKAIEVDQPADTPKDGTPPKDGEPASDPAPPAPPTPGKDEKMSAVDIQKRAVLAERTRAKRIKRLSASLKLGPGWADKQVECGASFDAIQAAALTAVAEKFATNNIGGGSVSIPVGEDQNLSSLRPAIGDAIRLRSRTMGPEDKPHERAQVFRNLSVLDMAREWLSELGAPDARQLSKTQIIERLSYRGLQKHYGALGVVQLAQSTGDFSYILEDTMNKTLGQVYADAPKTWERWARRATAPDFKTISRTKLSESPSLSSRDEGGGITYVTLTDSKETYALIERTLGIKLTRMALINDDMDAFNRIPTMQMMAAARAEDDVAYAIITANAAMSDSVAIFHASHSNLISSGGAAPSVATLSATEKLLMKQKGPKNAARMELRARHLLVPTSIFRTAQQVIASTVDPSKSNSAVNPFFNEGIEITASARLDDNSATAWYLLADYNLIDTVEVCFLESEPTPVLKQETDFDTEDMKFAIRHTVAAQVIDYRGMAKNPGA